MAKRDQDGFMHLISHTTRDGKKHPVHTDNDTFQDEAEYWKAKYKSLKAESARRVAELEETIQSMEQLIQTMDQAAVLADQLLDAYREREAELEAQLEFSTTLAEPDSCYTPGRFTSGVGLSVDFEHGAKIHKLGSAEKKKLSGIDVEVQPGRGFRIAPRWENKD